MKPSKSGRHPAAERTVVRLTAAAYDDLEGLLTSNPLAVRWALKKMIHLERNPEAGEILHATLVGWRKIVVGDRHWRVVWRVTHDSSGAVVVDVAEVWAVGARSDGAVYEEMRSRVASLGRSPATVPLTAIMDRLGEVAADVEAASEPRPPDVPPDWLVEVLTRTAGIPRAAVATMSRAQAEDVWATWTSSQP